MTTAIAPAPVLAPALPALSAGSYETARPEGNAIRGLFFGAMFSLPLWGAIAGVVWAVVAAVHAG